MPRRTKRDDIPPSRRRGTSKAPEDFEVIKQRVSGPDWAVVEGFEVRTSVKADRTYVCPFCSGPIRPGVLHVVAFPVGSVDERRHYHSGCWKKQRKIVRG